MAKFKVGDRVRVLRITEEMSTHFCNVTPAMEETCGHIGTIEECDNDGTYKVTFPEPIDDYWWYISEWIEPVEDGSYTADTYYPQMWAEMYRDQITANQWSQIYINGDFELETPKRSIMTKLNTMMKKLLDADTQKLVKAEFINGDLEITNKGREAIINHLFLANKKDMVKIAEEEINEQKNEEAN